MPLVALKHFLGEREATVLVVYDTTSDADFQLHSIVHGVVTLEELALDYGAERRRLRIAKMRGVKFRGGYHDFAIRTGGLEIFPRLVASGQTRIAPTEVFPSGSEQLDALFGGGLRRGSSALLIGPAGSGKSSIALSIAYSAAMRGQSSAIYAFDESIATLEARTGALGIKFKQGRQAGQVRVQQVDPAEWSSPPWDAALVQNTSQFFRVCTCSNQHVTRFRLSFRCDHFKPSFFFADS